MGRECSTQRGDDKFIEHFGRKTRREETLGKLRGRWEENID
jgi:hypothetical protein